MRLQLRPSDRSGRICDPSWLGLKRNFQFQGQKNHTLDVIKFYFWSSTLTLGRIDLDTALVQSFVVPPVIVSGPGFGGMKWQNENGRWKQNGFVPDSEIAKLSKKNNDKNDLTYSVMSQIEIREAYNSQHSADTVFFLLRRSRRMKWGSTPVDAASTKSQWRTIATTLICLAEQECIFISLKQCVPHSAGAGLVKVSWKIFLSQALNSAIPLWSLD